ncbi:MAG TPA: uroporphyrinogen decarboxylase family protein [bacterium]|nr:uroporphyrinogen decarboxylase family protein [bacterium]
MTGKECVQAAIAHKEIDYVPLGFYLADHDIIEKVIGRPTYVRNRIASQIAFWEGRRDEVVESYKKDTIEFYEKIDCVDLLTYKEACTVPPKDYDPDPPETIGDLLWRDREGRVFKGSELSNDIACIDDPTLGRQVFTLEQFQEEPVVEPPDPSVFEVFDALIAHFGRDRYIAGLSGGLETMVMLGGLEHGLMAYCLTPDIVKAAIAQRVKLQNALDDYRMRPGQDGILFEEDMASSKGPMISPEMYREFCFPALCERVMQCRKRGYQILLHNCGNNRPLMPMFIEAGIECYQSLQTIPEMDLGSLKQEFGDRMTFWGGIAVEVLIQGTPNDVRKNVRQAMQAGSPDGGFILGPSHSIAHNVGYDNFMAMLDEYMKMRM